MAFTVRVLHEVQIKDLDLLIAAFGIDPEKIAAATAQLEVSRAKLAESVLAAGVSTP